MKPMKQVQDKETWLDEVTGSIEGIQRPDANAFLYEKIKYRMEQGGAGMGYSRRTSNVLGWSVAIVLLLAVNGFSIISKISHEKQAVQTETTDTGLPEMQLETIYNY